MTGSEPERVRYHSLDALRASMMLLGIVLHVATSYTITIPRSVWPFKDPNTSIYADLLVVAIHSFRMPVFFVMAGFFAAMLRYRYGVAGMVKNRAIRVLVPLVLFWILLMPASITGIWFAYARAMGKSGLESVRTMAAVHPLWEAGTLHLWFLYFLLIFYVVALISGSIAARMPPAWLERASMGFRRVMTWRLRALIFAFPTALALFPEGGVFGDPSTLIPPFWTVVAYLTYFSFGWALFAHRELLSDLTRNAWSQTTAGILLFALLVILSSQASKQLSPAATMGAALFTSLISWLLMFGFTGLAIRYLERPIPALRYLTDSTYWCYLVHLPLAYWIEGLFAPIDLPAAVKIALVLAILIPLMLASYHFLVRSTLVGVMLNGRRYPAAPAEATA